MRDTSMRWPSMRDTRMGMVYWRCMSIKVIIVEKGFLEKPASLTVFLPAVASDKENP